MKFDLRNTTRIVFGVGEIARLGELVQGYSHYLGRCDDEIAESRRCGAGGQAQSVRLLT
ncbi:hypothetical protein [Mesorhizobium sp.]|uniref:hypothetical protein n=1 Tax=Mesorhizobium sp. TaxID=1871066 RepID=UPI001217DF06|nr:hypothetical protein [Mesorhizobium sp.]TIV32338.1 MAG: iron-containing alcohol dehydrogenase [Mesorhizobium sp.]TIV56831.1 MAG: iron-containing alcohol dehydrogenase [Mesorhizobium sp.]